MNRLKPTLGRFTMLAMAVGIIVGPWMPQMPFWFSLSGPSIALTFILVMLLAIPIILVYGELTAMIPVAGGGYAFARSAFKFPLSWLTGWFILLLYMNATAFMAPASARMLEAMLNISPDSEWPVIIVGILIMAAFSWLNTTSMSTSAKLQCSMVLGMVVVGLATVIWFFTSGDWNPQNLKPFFSTGVDGFLVAIGIMFLMVIGFDAVPQLAEEANYPPKDAVWIMLGAVIISETLFALICLANAGMRPTEWIVEQSVVSPEIARGMGGALPAFVMNAAGLLATLTCLNGFMIAAARIVFAMGRTKALPRGLGTTNRHDVPHKAVWLVFGLCSILVLFGGGDWLETLFVSAAFATGLVYTLTCCAAIVLRNKYPDWARPYKMPGGKRTGYLAVLVAISITIAVGMGMPVRAWLIFFAWLILGALLYGWIHYKRQRDPMYHDTDAIYSPGRVE